MRKDLPDLSDVRDVVDAVLRGHRTAVVFSPDLKNSTKATMKFWGRNGNARALDIVLTIGRLNYAERQFVKLCKNAGCKPKRPWLPKG